MASACAETTAPPNGFSSGHLFLARWRREPTMAVRCVKTISEVRGSRPQKTIEVKKDVEN